jgi:hypothetical protein
MVPIIEEVNAELAKITDGDVRRVERGMPAQRDCEEILGILHSEEARRLYTLSGMLATRAAGIVIEARLNANSEEEEKAAHYAFERMQAIAKLILEIFETQARDDLGGKAWCHRISVRSGWVVVVRKDPRDAFLDALSSAFEKGGPEPS